MKRWIAAIVASLVVATPATAEAEAPYGFLGMSAENVSWDAGAEQNKQLSQMRAHGVTELRQIIRWSYIEPVQDQLYWDLTDNIILNAARNNIRVLPIIGGETSWATSRPVGDTRNCLFPPRDNGDFANFIRLVVNRYGPTGTLWEQNPEFVDYALTRWQIWNEANTDTFWACDRSPKAYTQLSKVTANAIHEVDPGAFIISTGAPNKHGGDFLRKMVKNGAKSVFNAIALHPYKKDGDAVLKELKQARSLMNDLGLKKWKIRVTEFGWATSGPPDKEHTTDEARQARLIKNTITKVTAQREKLKVTGMTYYQWRDVDPGGGHDYWGLHTGIQRKNGTAKPALAALGEAARSIK